MMKNIIKITTLSFFGFIFIINSSLSIAQQSNDKTLYKWQDSTGKWFYSKTPPEPTNLPTKKIEVAKDARTIIFEEQKDNKTDEEQANSVIQQQIRQKRSTCQLIQSTMMDTAFALRKTNDKNFQEKNITTEEYEQEKLSIIKLEEISTDLSFYDICTEDFTKKPQIKAISNCMVEQNTMQTRIDCLKELPPI